MSRPCPQKGNKSGKHTQFNDRVTVAKLQDLPHPHMGQVQPPHTGTLPGPPPLPDGANTCGTQYHSKLSVVTPLLKWQGINQNVTLPMKLWALHAAAPPDAPRNTPELAGKWLCFHYCTEGLFCHAQSEGKCSFAHVDLAQPGLWHWGSLHPIMDWLAQLAAAELGLSLTQVGTQALLRGPS